jgi:hypothetical protein
MRGLSWRIKDQADDQETSQLVSCKQSGEDPEADKLQARGVGGQPVIRPRAHPPLFEYVTCQRSDRSEHGARVRNEHHNPPPRLSYLALALTCLSFLILCVALEVPTYTLTLLTPPNVSPLTRHRGRPCTLQLPILSQPLDSPAPTVTATRGRETLARSSCLRGLVVCCCVAKRLSISNPPLSTTQNQNRDRNRQRRST